MWIKEQVTWWFVAIILNFCITENCSPWFTHTLQGMWYCWKEKTVASGGFLWEPLLRPSLVNKCLAQFKQPNSRQLIYARTQMHVSFTTFSRLNQSYFLFSFTFSNSVILKGLHNQGLKLLQALKLNHWTRRCSFASDPFSCILMCSAILRGINMLLIYFDP